MNSVAYCIAEAGLFRWVPQPCIIMHGILNPHRSRQCDRYKIHVAFQCIEQLQHHSTEQPKWANRELVFTSVSGCGSRLSNNQKSDGNLKNFVWMGPFAFFQIYFDLSCSWGRCLDWKQPAKPRQMWNGFSVIGRAQNTQFVSVDYVVMALAICTDCKTYFFLFAKKKIGSVSSLASEEYKPSQHW